MGDRKWESGSEQANFAGRVAVCECIGDCGCHVSLCVCVCVRVFVKAMKGVCVSAWSPVFCYYYCCCSQNFAAEVVFVVVAFAEAGNANC